MKTVLVLTVLLCTAFAAPEEEQAKEVAAGEAPNEEPAAAPELSPEEIQEPESRFNLCPDGWYSHNSRCYLIVNTAKSWYNAEEHCNNLGASLASVSNPREYGFLQGIAKISGDANTWLGGFNLQGIWMWINREGFYYTNWYGYTSSSSYPCIYLRTSSGWGNYRCSNAYRFICSKKLYSC